MDQRIIQLFQKYLQGQCNAEELKHVMQLLEEGSFREEWQHVLSQDAAHIQARNLESPLSTQETETLYQRIEQDMRFAKKTKLFSGWYYAAAAIFLVALATALYFYRSESTIPDIAPGGNRATLTLADGTKINLDSAKAGIQINDEHIVYNDKTPLNVILSGVRENEGKGAEGSLPTSLSLSTPKGGQYQIILSDGTKVWLNAATTLKYPARFSEDKREVELDGEAFFEVNHKPGTLAPFVVKSQHQETTVLGTSFNISSYDNEKAIRTTLVSGLVRVSQTVGAGILLAPKEQAIWQNGKFTKQKADIDKEIAWRKGLFSFDHKSFTQVMAELARWYDLDVTYEGPVPTDTFFGIAFRNEKLSLVLSLLESAGVSYRMEKGRSGASNKLIISNHKKEEKTK